jgi:LPS-assembly protein
LKGFKVQAEAPAGRQEPDRSPNAHIAEKAPDGANSATPRASGAGCPPASCREFTDLIAETMQPEEPTRMAAADRQYRRRRCEAVQRLPAVLGCILLLWAFMVPSAPAHAQGEPAAGPRLAPLDPQLPWTIEADRVRYDQPRDEYIAEGSVVIAKMDRSISADLVRYSRLTRMIYAEGHVTLIAGSDVLSGSYLEFDMESEKGHLDDGLVFIKENNYHLKGERIEKVGADLYSIDRGTVTTCDGSPPDWKISGSDIKVHDDGAGSAWNALIYVRDVPLLYSPYVSFPARNKRQSGFLFPEFGYSQRKGAFYSQPFYWAIDDQSDATFYLEYMSERGVKPGLEYRYYLNRDAKGAVMFDFLHDEQIDNGEGNSSKDWGYDDDSFLRPNRDRYWFRMSHYNPLPGGATGRLDLDIVSDQDYLRMFRKGYMGFEDSSVFFNKFLGRVLDDYDDPVRVNQLLISKAWPGFSLNAGTLLYDDANKGQNWKDVTQRLPVVRFAAPKQTVAESPFMYNLSSEYDNFWRERGFGVQRMDLWPRLYYPYFVPPYVTVEPSVGFRQTVWDQYQTADTDAWSDDGYFHRELYDTRMVVGTDFYKLYDVDGESLKRIKHRVIPEVAHTYVPEASQDNLPNIDSRDRIENRNRVSYSLTNILTSKSLRLVPGKEVAERDGSEGAAITPEGDYDYRDVLRWKVGQYYDFARHFQPFSTVLSKLTLAPAEKISFDNEVGYNTYTNLPDRFNLSATIGAKKKEHLTIGYRYLRDTVQDAKDRDDEYQYGQIVEPEKTAEQQQINSLYTEARIGLTDSFSLLGSYTRDFASEDVPAYGLGFIYESQCWTLEAVFGLEEEDVGLRIRIRLKGIGDFGL